MKNARTYAIFVLFQLSVCVVWRKNTRHAIDRVNERTRSRCTEDVESGGERYAKIQRYIAIRMR